MFQRYGEIEVKRKDIRQSQTFFFYSLDGKHFRDWIFLKEEDALESMRNKTKLYDSLEDNLKDFMRVVKDQDAVILFNSMEDI